MPEGELQTSMTCPLRDTRGGRKLTVLQMFIVRAFHSSLLDRHGFRHAFATRAGGVSSPPYHALNLGFHLGDDDEAVRENRARFAQKLGITLDRLFEQRQVHGNHVREVADTDDTAAIANAEGDALVARTHGLAVAARTADCVPILIAHPPSGHVAAVHAGWRGAVAGIVPKAVEALSHDARELIVAIGPHIRVGAFEIGEEVAREMERAAGGRPVVNRSRAKPHGDLAALIRLQLWDAGLPRDAIDDVGGCTHTDAAHFFSHRRDHGKTGRHLSAIVASC
jgi:YfiH family protein